MCENKGAPKGNKQKKKMGLFLVKVKRELNKNTHTHIHFTPQTRDSGFLRPHWRGGAFVGVNRREPKAGCCLSECPTKRGTIPAKNMRTDPWLCTRDPTLGR